MAPHDDETPDGGPDRPRPLLTAVATVVVVAFAIYAARDLLVMIGLIGLFPSRSSVVERVERPPSAGDLARRVPERSIASAPARAAGRRRIEAAGSVPEGAVYDVAMSPTLPGTHASLSDRQPTTVKFSIGPSEPGNAVPPDQRDVSADIRGAAGPLSLTVVLNCGACKDGVVDHRSIVFDPKTQRSTTAMFEIVPDVTATESGTHRANLVFLVTADSVAFDSVAVPVWVDPPIGTDESLATEGRTSGGIGAGAARSDLELSVSTVGDQVRLTFSARNPKVRRHVQQNLGSTAEIWGFQSTLTRNTIDQQARAGYGQLKLVMDHIRGGKVDGDGDALMSDYSQSLLDDHEKEQMLSGLADVGEGLYDALFRPVPGTIGERIVQAIESYDAKTLRLTIYINSDLYLPWQLLKRPQSSSAAFWGFKYEMAVHPTDVFKLIPRSGLELADTDPTPFALWNQDQEQPGQVGWYAVREQARIAALLRHPQPELLSSKKQALEYFEKHHTEIKLLLTYMHATSATRLVFEDEQTYTGAHGEIDGGARLIFADKADEHLTAFELRAFKRRWQTDTEPAFPKRPVVILNACETAAAPFYSPLSNADFTLSLPITMIMAGARAVVGTDAPVQALSAVHFEDVLVRALFNGVPAATAVHAARMKLWESKNPMGLLYSLYGDPEARLSIKMSAQ